MQIYAKEEKIQLIGFGTFEVRERSARKGRNPQTGEEIEIAASKKYFSTKALPSRLDERAKLIIEKHFI
jgi:nucleoid DNA-binding protein